ncbi:MAG TPA: GNVR domain-containing protein [Longimicrobiales bacterium]
MSRNLPAPYDPGSADDPGAVSHAARFSRPELGGVGAVEPPGTDWRRYLSAVYRYKWLVLAFAVAGGVAGAALTRFVAPQYLVQTTIWVASHSDRGGSETEPIRTGQVLSASGWIDLLKTYVVLDGVVRDLKLYLSERSPGRSPALETFGLKARVRPGAYRLRVGPTGRTFTLETHEGQVLQRGEVGDSVGPAQGFAWVPMAEQLQPGTMIEFTVESPRDVARDLADRIKPQIDPNGNILRLELRGSDPERITAVLNAVTDRYVLVAGELERAKLTELTKILEDQLDAAERSLRQAEAELEAFQVRTAGMPRMKEGIGGGATGNGGGGGGDPIYADYFQLKLEQERLRRDRMALERVLAQVRDAGLSVAALEFIPAVAQSSAMMKVLEELTLKRAELRSLRYRYTSEHRQVQLLEQEIAQLEKGTIPRLLRQMIDEIALRQGELDRALGTITGEMQEIPLRSIEEARLKRRVAVAEELFTTLRHRYEGARVAAISAIPDVRVLDRATPPHRPVQYTGSRLLLVALAGGLIVGIFGAIALDRVDMRIRYPDQVTDGLGLPILGGIPHVKGGKLVTDAPAPVVEAFRTIRLGLVHAHGTAGPLVATVSSPGAGDGKSYFAANLALTFANIGFATLLVDGDIRRGALHRLLHGSRKPGLTDLLAGAVRPEEVIRETGNRSLHLIGCGTRMATGPELLNSPALAALLADARQRYDVVLVDSCPLGAGADPFILGTLTGNLILVLRTGTTNRMLTEAKLGFVDRLPIRILGAVLNDIPVAGGFHYSSYVPYAILPGYTAETEGAEARGGSQPD